MYSPNWRSRVIGGGGAAAGAGAGQSEAEAGGRLTSRAPVR